MKYILALLLVGNMLNAQLSYNTSDHTLSRSEVVHPEEITDDYFPHFLYEAPLPGHGGIADLKKKVSEKFPRQDVQQIQLRGDAQPPSLLEGFDPFGGNQSGIPPDNSFGINASGQTISAINSDLSFRTETGGFIRNFSLQSFSQGVALNARKFDPRVIYDPMADRFVMVWLAGTISDDSNIVIAFSSGPDITGTWNVYGMSGSPFGPGEWTDYPMISVTDKEVFLTINLIADNGSWQEGFNQTVLYQIGKEEGYDGTDIDYKTWSDINFDGKPIRNLHPVKAADENLVTETYFLSNRNFDIENDSIFVLKINSDKDDPNVALNIEVRSSDTNYGAPPNGQQSGGGELQTNDARILDAFRIGDHIQFVGNTVDPASGKAAVYHGQINNLSSTINVTGRIITHDTRDLGYPAIAWTGQDESEIESIIVSEYSNVIENPGISTLYMDNDGDYSDQIVIQSSNTFVDMIGAVERWGDYTGCQRKYDRPGEVWIASAFVGDNNTYRTWVTGMTRPMESAVAEIANDQVAIDVYPNPTAERINVKMDIASRDRLTLSLYNAEGALVTQFFNAVPKKVGTLDFSFDLGSLDVGSYFFTATQSNKVIATKPVVKN